MQWELPVAAANMRAPRVATASNQRTPAPMTTLAAESRGPGVPSSENMVHCIFGHEAQDPKELTVNIGDVVEIMSNERNWWKVRNAQGRTGFVPKTHLGTMAGVPAHQAFPASSIGNAAAATTPRLDVGVAAGKRAAAEPKKAGAVKERAVCNDDKYRAGWALLSTAEGDELEAMLLALRDGLGGLTAAFADYLFHPECWTNSGIITDGGMELRGVSVAEEGHGLHASISASKSTLAKAKRALAALTELQEREGRAVLDKVAELAEVQYAAIPGTPGDLGRVGEDLHRLQEVPACFKGLDSPSSNIEAADWDPEVRAVVYEAARLIEGGKLGAPGTSDYPANPNDETWKNIKRKAEAAKNGGFFGKIGYPDYLMARSLTGSAGFHARVKRALAGVSGVQYDPVVHKGSERFFAKMDEYANQAAGVSVARMRRRVIQEREALTKKHEQEKRSFYFFCKAHNHDAEWLAEKMAEIERTVAEENAETSRLRADYKAVLRLPDNFIDKEVPAAAIKDGARGAAMCNTHDAAVATHRRLAEAFPRTDLVITKDRRAMPECHDILVVVCHEGLLCEVQICFAQTFPLKAFSHVAYNLLRLETVEDVLKWGRVDLGPLATIYEYPMDRMDERSRSEVVCKLHF